LTSVQFYHNASDPLALACELVGNAHRGRRRAIVVCPDAEQARRLDRQLWTAHPGDFIPHVLNGSPLAAETPVVIGIAGDADWPHTDLLFNFAPEFPTACERFRMVVEIIGPAEAERIPARERWKRYKQEKFPLKAFDAERRIAL